MKKLAIAAMAVCFAVVFSSCGLFVPRPRTDEAEEATLPEFTLPDITIPEISIPDITVPEYTAPELDLDRETQTIGDSRVGYMEIPADFVEFQDVEGGNDLQYSDKTGTVIYTMNVIEADVDAEQAGQSIAAHLQEEGAEDITGATVTVGSYDAKQVYCYYADVDKYLVIDLIEVGGKVYYVSAEFPLLQSTYLEYVDTWTAP